MLRLGHLDVAGGGGKIMDMPAQIAPRLTEQDPRMAAGAVVFDCRPALLPVSLDVSGIDNAGSPAFDTPCKVGGCPSRT